jgi:xanthine dehydrogenase accessory factor
MSEMAEILSAFDALCGEGKPCALATVIAVEGSAYRRPSARMLVAEDGRTWGGVSGGCLERDVARRARGVIASGRGAVCRYDTTDDEELAGGAATGCGGTIDLFIQPLSREMPGPLDYFALVVKGRQSVTVATVIRAGGKLSDRIGISTTRSDGDWLDAMASSDQELADCFDEFVSATDALARIVHVDLVDGSADLFVEWILPPQSLVIFGGGPDAAPVVAIAKTLGWHVTVVGARPSSAMPERFGMADVLCVTPADDPTEGVEIRAGAAVVLMTHNFARDRLILENLPARLGYLGILGPRLRTDRLLSELGRENIAGPIEPFAPVGLDLGARTPPEIALSIVAEIQGVIRGTAPVSLRDRPGPIHPIVEAVNQDGAPGGVVQSGWERACPA